jgi:hypothetical protein
MVRTKSRRICREEIKRGEEGKIQKRRQDGGFPS